MLAQGTTPMVRAEVWEVEWHDGLPWVRPSAAIDPAGETHGENGVMTMLSAIPSLPVLDVAKSVGFYTGKLPFEARHQEDGFAILVRDEVEIHLWAANKPDVPGAEPSLAGSASCRVRVDEIDSFYQDCQRAEIVHPHGGLAAQPWGTREFTVLDPDNNCITFYQAVSA